MKTTYSLERKDATHRLSCRHAIGRHSYDYEMDCIVLKSMGNGKLKILVFGERYWKGGDDIKKIRYVDIFRVGKKRDGVKK